MVAVVDGTVVVGMVIGLKSRVCSCGKRYLVRWALWSAVLLLAVVVAVVVIVVVVAVRYGGDVGLSSVWSNGCVAAADEYNC